MVFVLSSDSTSAHCLEQLLHQSGAVTVMSEFLTECHQRSLPIPALWTEQANNFSYSGKVKSHQALLLASRGQKLLRSAQASILVHIAAVNLAKLTWLQLHFPQAYFIHLVRNGYAVALELRDWLQQNYPPQPLLLQRTAKQWARGLELLSEQLKKFRPLPSEKFTHFLELRYEQLLTNPLAISQQIAEFLNIEPRFDNFLKVVKSESKSQDFKPILMTGVINPDLARLQQMTLIQQVIIRQAAGQMLKHYGYW